MTLTSPDLMRTDAYIDGAWTAADCGCTFEVKNPATGALIERVADCGGADTERAVVAAHRAFAPWSRLPAGKRARLLYKWYDLQKQHLTDLTQLLTAEQGKPLAEAKGEILYGMSFVKWFAEEARRAYGETIPSPARDQRITTIKQPVGVVAAITPWNFPHAMITRKIAPALAAGCTVVLKPAEDTPLSALALAQLAHEAGFPPGVINVLPTSDPADVGSAMTRSPLVRKLSFTGSTRVGRLLMEQCAPTLKKLSLELGGNAPFIVFNDADLDAAVAGGMAAKYRNAGQTCICVNRFYVQAGVYAAFVKKLTSATRALTVGNGSEAGVEVGPLINRAGHDKVTRLVQQALAQGAQRTTGAPTDEGLYYTPTVLADVTPGMDLHQEEIFGPVAAVYRFETEAEVLALANDTPFGLASYFYTRDVARCWRVAEALEYGMVGVNSGSISTPVAPFGGVKQSGFGREGSHYGLAEFMTVKYMNWGV